MTESKRCPFCGSEMFAPHFYEDMLLCTNEGCYFYSVYLPVITFDKISARIAQLTAERDELEAENNKAKSLIGMKDDSLETYDEFYTRCLVAIGYPPDSNPTSALDVLIVCKLLAIAQLEAENSRLSGLLHDEMGQLEIATDLGDKRWRALNDIYTNSQKHNADWSRRKAQEGLGIKNG